MRMVKANVVRGSHFAQEKCELRKLSTFKQTMFEDNGWGFANIWLGSLLFLHSVVKLRVCSSEQNKGSGLITQLL